MEQVDGRKHTGLWKGDLKHGFGIQTLADGSTISSTWIEGKLHGFGIYETPSKHRKYGVWKQGKKVSTLSDQQKQDFENNIEEAKQFLGASDAEWEQILEFTQGIFEASKEFHQSSQEFQEQLLTHKKEVTVLLNRDVVIAKPKLTVNRRQKSELSKTLSVATEESEFSVHSPMISKQKYENGFDLDSE